MRVLQPCGTFAASQRHYAHGEPQCEPCRLAKNARQRSRTVWSTTTASARIADWLETHGEQAMWELDDGIPAKSLECIRRQISRMVSDGRVVKVPHSDVFGWLPSRERFTYRLPEDEGG